MLHTYAGVEVGVAATKTFTTQVTLMYLLALRLAEVRDRLGEARFATSSWTRCASCPYTLFQTLESLEGVEEVAQRHHAKSFFFFLGRHAGLPVCLEGALKLKEVSYIPTESYAAGEMKHGPIALLEDETPVVCVATRSHVSDKLSSNLQEVRARGAEVIAIATAGDEQIRENADHVIYVPAHAPAAAGRGGGHPAAAAGLPHRDPARARRRPAAQPRQDRDGGIAMGDQAKQRFRRSSPGRARPRSDPMAALHTEIMLLREENARLQTEQYRRPNLGTVLEQARALADTGAHGADAADEAAQMLADGLVVRESLLKVCREMAAIDGLARATLLTIADDDHGGIRAAGPD